jgi:hypothetical protein
MLAGPIERHGIAFVHSGGIAARPDPVGSEVRESWAGVVAAAASHPHHTIQPARDRKSFVVAIGPGA